MSSGKKKGGGDDGANPGETWKLAAAAAATGIGIAASAWGLFGSVSKEAEPKADRKKMKAPGRNGDLIYRDDFVQSPSDYFRQLRNDGKSEKSKLFGSDSEEEEPQDNRKMMKAPGRNGDLIYRDDFVQSPSDYFRQLRSDTRSQK